MSQLDEKLGAALLSAYQTKFNFQVTQTTPDQCDCDLCHGTGRLSIPFLGWTYCGCDRKATPSWGNHDHS